VIQSLRLGAKRPRAKIAELVACDRLISNSGDGMLLVFGFKFWTVLCRSLLRTQLTVP